MTRKEKALLLSVDKDLKQVVKQVATYVRDRGEKISIGTRRDPRYSTHLPFDDDDWEIIEQWVQKKGRKRINHITEERTSKRDLILHVAKMILKDRESK